jgi:hypothetical protein
VSLRPGDPQAQSTLELAERLAAAQRSH